MFFAGGELLATATVDSAVAPLHHGGESARLGWKYPGGVGLASFLCFVCRELQAQQAASGHDRYIHFAYFTVGGEKKSKKIFK